MLAFEPDDLRSYGRIVRDGDGRLARIVEAADASPDELALARGQLRHLRLPRPRSSGRCSTGSSRTTRRASSTSPTRSACSSPTARRSPSTRRRRAWEVEGINTRVELAFVAGKLRDRINEAHMLAGVTIVDPALDLDRGRRRDRARRDDPPAHRHPRRRSRDRRAASRSGPFAYIRPGTVARRGREDRHVRRGQEVDASAPARRSRTSPTSATPRSARIRTSPPGNITANFPHEPGSRRAGRRSAATSGPASTMCSMHLSTWATTLGLRRVRSSPMMSLRARSPGSRRARRQRKGGSTRSMESLTGTLSSPCRASRGRR